MNNPKVLIIVPAFNEAGNIYKSVKEIEKNNFVTTIVVVDDGSLDNTQREAKKTNAVVVSLPLNLGIGGAVQTGFQYARDHDFDIAVQVDGDGQHDVAYLKVLIDPILKAEADMTIGSRFLPPYLGYQSSFVRRIGINFFAYLISFLTGFRTTDPTSGFRAYNRKMIKFFSENYPQDFPEPEAIVLARQHNMRLKEIPVEMRKRSAGHSSIRYLKTLYYMIKVTLAIFLVKLRRKKNIEQ